MATLEEIQRAEYALLKAVEAAANDENGKLPDRLDASREDYKKALTAKDQGVKKLKKDIEANPHKYIRALVQEKDILFKEAFRAKSELNSLKSETENLVYISNVLVSTLLDIETEIQGKPESFVLSDLIENALRMAGYEKKYVKVSS